MIERKIKIEESEDSIFLWGFENKFADLYTMLSKTQFGRI